MGIAEEIIRTIFDAVLPGVKDGINSIADFLFQNVNTTLGAYKSQTSVDLGWGSLPGILGLLLGGLILVLTVFGIRTIIRRGLRIANREDALPPSYQWGLAFLVSVVFQLTIAQGANPISIAKRVRTDLAYVSAILNNQLPGYGVDMSGFTLGLLQNTLAEFVLQVGLLTFAISLIAWWYTDFVTWPDEVEFLINFAPMVVPPVLWIYATVEGIQVFPIPGRTAFLIQVLSLVGISILIAAVLVWFGYLLMIWPPLDLSVDRPRKLWLTFDGVMLALLTAVAGSGLGGLISWTFLKIGVLRLRPNVDLPGKRSAPEEIPGGD